MLCKDLSLGSQKPLQLLGGCIEIITYNFYYKEREGEEKRGGKILNQSSTEDHAK